VTGFAGALRGFGLRGRGGRRRFLRRVVVALVVLRVDGVVVALVAAPAHRRAIQRARSGAVIAVTTTPAPIIVHAVTIMARTLSRLPICPRPARAAHASSHRQLDGRRSGLNRGRLC